MTAAEKTGASEGKGRSPLRWGAIALGVGLDIGATQFFVTAIATVVGLHFATAHRSDVPDLAASQAALRAAMAEPSVFLLTSVVGLLCSLAGGLLTAHLAKTRLLLNATVMGLCSGVVGLFMLGAAGGGVPGWAEGASAMAAVPAALLGGQIGRLIAARRGKAP